MYDYENYEGDYLPFSQRPSSPNTAFPHYIPAVELPPDVTFALLGQLAGELLGELLEEGGLPYIPTDFTQNTFVFLQSLAQDLLEDFWEEFRLTAADSCPQPPCGPDDGEEVDPTAPSCPTLTIGVRLPICGGDPTVEEICPPTPPCPLQEDSFASFVNYACPFTDGTLLPLVPAQTDSTGRILLTDSQHLSLAPGYYHISYHVSARLDCPGYMQVTPSYGGTAHLEQGISFCTTGQGGSAYGSHSLLVHAAQTTDFSLAFHTNSTATGGNLSLTVVRLHRGA